ncbi:MAG: sensor histidine kinase [Chloroflexi bacterium]|nr:sensor histidine kinase [Chloroflexota bacterium]
MKNLLRQTNDPEVEAGLEETRPFFWFLILVLIFLYGISITSDPTLRQLSRFIPYTTLFCIHIGLHWYMPYLVTQKRRLAAYLAVQIFLVILLILISQQSGIVIGLYMALAGETIGILEDWRRSLVAIAGYLVLMGLTYGLIWGWDAAPGWLGMALMMLLFVLIYVMLFLRQLNARMESQHLLSELQEAHTQLAEYAQQVETLTLEAERQRMARELHDTLAQGLAGLALQLEAVEASLERGNTAQALQITGQAKERVRTTLADARRAIDDLRATGTTTTETINREVARFMTATGILCTVEMPPTLNVSERNGEHMVRCVSEGLANVTRHAQATQVWLTVGEENGRLHIQIRDNGQGFDPSGRMADGHYGLLGLRERARLAGGELTIKSGLGAGTTLSMTIPIQTDNGQRSMVKGQRTTENTHDLHPNRR